MKRLFQGKIKFLILAIVILSAGTLLTTISFLSNVTETKANFFSNGIVNIKIVENFHGGDIQNGPVQKQVRVMNSSEKDKLKVVPVYIRARLVSTWKDAVGNVMAVDSESLVDYHLTKNSGWVLGDDGYFYYTKAVYPDTYTDYLLDSVGKKKDAVLPKDGKLEIQVLADGVQTTGNAINNAWGTPKSNRVSITFWN